MKERLVVQKLIDEFITNKNSPSIAILTGIRRVGKTTVLKQLQNKYNRSAYIVIQEGTKDLNNELSDLIDSDIDILFIDEFTSLDQYDILAQEIYNHVVTKNIKVIITGSSPYHLNELSYRGLGGGRACLFKLNPITFTEYLYFTNKIKSYDDIDNIKNEWFIDYLKLDGLTPGLCVNLDTTYFSSWDKNNKEIDNNTCIHKIKSKLTTGDLLAIFNLIAYNLIDETSYSRMINPKIGGKEHVHLYPRKLGYKLKNIDLTNLFISDSVRRAKDISEEKISQILLFLLDSGLALASSYGFSEFNISDIREFLSSANTKKDVNNLLDMVTIQLVSPLFYVCIGEEIFKRFGVTLDVLDKGFLTGMLLEVYLGGAIQCLIPSLDISQYKLTSGGRDNIREVDIFIPSEMIMIESTMSNKKKDEIYLNDCEQPTNLKVRGFKSQFTRLSN